MPQADVTLRDADSGAAQRQGASAEPGAFAAERLGGGWRLLTNCRLGTTVLKLILIRSQTGVALLEIDPAWTPDAVDLVRARLNEAGFASRFPGNLPLIHRQIRPSDVPRLEEILAQAFVGLEPFTLDADGGWEDAVEALLKPAGAAGIIAPGNPPTRHAAAPRHLVATAADALALHPASAPPFAAGPETDPRRDARDARPRSKAWMGFVAAGASAAAFLMLPNKAVDAPGPAAGPRTGDGASPTSQIDTRADEAAARAATAGTPGPTPIAVAPMPAQAEGADDARILAVPVSAPFAQTGADARPPMRTEPPAEPHAVQGSSSWVLPAYPGSTSPLPEAAAIRDVRIWSPSLLAPIGDRLEPQSIQTAPMESPPADAERVAPLPEAGPVEGEPFWTRSMPKPPEQVPEPGVPGTDMAEERPDSRQLVPAPVAERVEPLPEEAPLRGQPFWAAPSDPAPAMAMPAAPPPPVVADRPPPASAPVRSEPGAPAAPVATRAPTTMSPADIETARRRGEALVALGDISGGRRFLERAALAGSGAAALAMAESFDPRLRAARGVIGMPPDPAAALVWYRRAHALGVAESAARIATLEAER